jgi:hypothetical protein
MKAPRHRYKEASVARRGRTGSTPLDISFAIFDPCEVFNPMKMPRQSPLQ